MSELSRFYGDPDGIYRNREAVVEIDGRDNGYLVKLFSSDKLIETRRVIGKTLQYAEDCAENWILGVIK